MDDRGQQQRMDEVRPREREDDACGCLRFCTCRRKKREEGSARFRKETARKKKKSWRRRMWSGYGETIGEKELEEEAVVGADTDNADHLVILVNGIIGSPNDWKFAAEHMTSRLGRQVAIHCSCNNSALKTFNGVDVMGRRLATEVREVIESTPSATRISFVSHSLGGLVSRYAISQLYRPPILHVKDSDEGATNGTNINASGGQSEVTIGGLKPENFITLATPHLGSRGPEQLPFLLGISSLEKLAPSIAPWFVGKTGKHLFLADGTDKELPLLLRMAKDCREGQFVSSLGAFKRRVAYANVVNDHMVGWRTSSICLKSEKPDINRRPVDSKYPHVIREEEPGPPQGENFTVAVLRKEGKRGQDSFEEEMVVGLNQVEWHKVDVRFKGEKGSYQAHNLIQVKNWRIHSAGADVIDHMIDKHFVADHLDELNNLGQEKE